MVKISGQLDVFQNKEGKLVARLPNFSREGKYQGSYYLRCLDNSVPKISQFTRGHMYSLNVTRGYLNTQRNTSEGGRRFFDLYITICEYEITEIIEMGKYMEDKNAE